MQPEARSTGRRLVGQLVHLQTATFLDVAFVVLCAVKHVAQHIGQQLSTLKAQLGNSVANLKLHSIGVVARTRELLNNDFLLAYDVEVLLNESGRSGDLRLCNDRERNLERGLLAAIDKSELGRNLVASLQRVGVLTGIDSKHIALSICSSISEPSTGNSSVVACPLAPSTLRGDVETIAVSAVLARERSVGSYQEEEVFLGFLSSQPGVISLGQRSGIGTNGCCYFCKTELRGFLTIVGGRILFHTTRELSLSRCTCEDADDCGKQIS